MRAQSFFAFSVGLASLVVALGPPKNYSEGIPKEYEDREVYDRKNGFVAGVTGEYFRYKHIFSRHPAEEDREESRDIAARIRCDACTAILTSLISKSKSSAEDDLADALEGHADYEKTGDRVTDQMLAHKQGCNKHFKDELIFEGYVLRKCKDVVEDSEDAGACLHKLPEKPGPMAVDTYEIWKEGLFYACEQTVGHHGDELAEHLAAVLENRGRTENHTAISRAACEMFTPCGDDVAKATGISRANRTKSWRAQQKGKKSVKKTWRSDEDIQRETLNAPKKKVVKRIVDGTEEKPGKGKKKKKRRDAEDIDYGSSWYRGDEDGSAEL